MKNKKVLVTATNYSIYCMDAKRLLESNGISVIESTYGRPMTKDELFAVIEDIDGVIAGVDTWDEEIFLYAKKLKIIARFGVGVDNIDIKSAKRRGIVVTNAKGMNSNPVAELTVALMFCCLRNIPNFNTSIRKGGWDRFMGRDLSGMTVGLLGFGAIAQKTAQKLSGFDVTLKAYDLYPDLEKAKSLGVTMASMDELLATSDIVSMHLPSTAATYHIMNDGTFEKMKEGAYFVNTARGALVDENALFRALKYKLCAAASDVFEQEPVNVENPLFSLPNFFATPHTASETYATYKNIGLETAQAVLEVFSGRKPRNCLV